MQLTLPRTPAAAVAPIATSTVAWSRTADFGQQSAPSTLAKARASSWKSEELLHGSARWITTGDVGIAPAVATAAILAASCRARTRAPTLSPSVAAGERTPPAGSSPHAGMGAGSWLLHDGLDSDRGPPSSGELSEELNESQCGRAACGAEEHCTRAPHTRRPPRLPRTRRRPRFPGVLRPLREGPQSENKPIAQTMYSASRVLSTCSKGTRSNNQGSPI